METETELRVFRINLKCPDCESIMRLVSVETQTKLNKYKCSRCGANEESNIVYPYLKYKPKCNY